MADLRWITSDADLPTDRQYVLIAYGENNGLLRHSAGLTYSIDRGLNANLLEAHLQTVISEAQTLADFWFGRAQNRGPIHALGRDVSCGSFCFSWSA